MTGCLRKDGCSWSVSLGPGFSSGIGNLQSGSVVRRGVVGALGRRGAGDFAGKRRQVIDGRGDLRASHTGGGACLRAGAPLLASLLTLFRSILLIELALPF